MKNGVSQNLWKNHGNPLSEIMESQEPREIRYAIVQDDFFHWDEDGDGPSIPNYRYASLEKAEEECRRQVEDSLRRNYRPGISKQAMYSHFRGFASCPRIVSSPPSDISFSALVYAQKVCAEICVHVSRKSLAARKKKRNAHMLL